jgi:exodeoxyribonuclease VII small subunit
MATKKARFEESLKRLEEIVRELEGEDLTLEESIAKFEEGVRLGKVCRELLDKAEARIKLLVENEKGALEEREESDEIGK